MTEEEYLHDCIRRLQEQYVAAAKPYVDMLVKLRQLQPTPVFMVVKPDILKILKAGETE